MKTDVSPPTISSKGTPKIIRGFMNFSQVKIFSSLLQSTHPETSNPRKFECCHNIKLFINARIKRISISPGTLVYRTCDFTSIRARLRFICQMIKNTKNDPPRNKTTTTCFAIILLRSKTSKIQFCLPSPENGSPT